MASKEESKLKECRCGKLYLGSANGFDRCYNCTQELEKEEKRHDEQKEAQYA